MNSTTAPNNTFASNVNQDVIEKDQQQELMVPNTMWGKNFLDTNTHRDKDRIAVIASAKNRMGNNKDHSKLYPQQRFKRLQQQLQ